MNEITQISPLEVGGIIGFCIVMSQGLIGIIKLLINKRFTAKNDNTKPTGDCKAIFPDEVKSQVKTLYDLHCRFDDDGAPLWYVPRSWASNQAKMVELLNRMVINQDNQAKILDKIADKIN